MTYLDPGERYPARYLAMTVAEFTDAFAILDAPMLWELAGAYAGYPHLGDDDESAETVRSSALRRFSPAGYWIGKAFEPERLAGWNRVVTSDGSIAQAHPFAFAIEPSALDGSPACVLTYEQSPPGYESVTLRDELRRVTSDLYIGFASAIGADGDLRGALNPFVLTGPLGASDRPAQV